LKGLFYFFEMYRENRFENALIYVKEIAFEMDVESKFCEKQISYRKKLFWWKYWEWNYKITSRVMYNWFFCVCTL